MFFVSTCTRGASAAGFALCQGSPAASHGHSELCPPCVADEEAPSMFPTWGCGSQCGQARPPQSSLVPRPSPVGHTLPIGYQWKKCEDRFRCAMSSGYFQKGHRAEPHLTFVLCMASTCPHHPRTLCQGVLGCWHGPCPGRDQNSPFLSHGEERAAVPEPRDVVEGESSAGIGPMVRDKNPQAARGGQGEGRQRGTAELCGQCPSPCPLPSPAHEDPPGLSGGAAGEGGRC